MTCSAVLFDTDGVLVDSEPIINAAEIRALAEFGVEARPTSAGTVGSTIRTTLPRSLGN